MLPCMYGYLECLLAFDLPQYIFFIKSLPIILVAVRLSIPSNEYFWHLITLNKIAARTPSVNILSLFIKRSNFFAFSLLNAGVFGPSLVPSAINLAIQRHPDHHLRKTVIIP